MRKVQPLTIAVAKLAKPHFHFGSLKELADAYGVSYPTLRLRLDRLIQKIKILDSEKIEDGYERVLRAQFADGKLDGTTFKQLLTAYQEQKKGSE